MAENLLKSTSTVGSMTLMSRVLGFTRDMVCATLFGASAGYDAFLVAFKIPNFMRSLFAEGAFAQAFVPLLSEQRVENQSDKTRDFVDKVAGSLALICALVTLLGMLGAPLLVRLFAPGFPPDSDRFLLASGMLKITFPYLLFITLTALGGGILNTYGKYGPPAFTPVLLNIAMIFAGIVLSPLFHTPVVALAWGVFLGGLLQMTFQIPFLLKIGLLPRFRPNFRDPAVKRLLKQMMPALVGVSVVQINLLVSTLFASYLPVGSVSWLYYADRLTQFPLGVFGVAITTVVLPHLSRRFAEQNDRAYRDTLGWAVNMCLLIGLPAALGLYLMATPLISVLFQHGLFVVKDVIATTSALRAYSVGIVSFILVKVLAAAFYARQDIKTPARIAVYCLLVNMVVSAISIQYVAHVGLAIANTASSFMNVLILVILLVQRGYLVFSKEHKTLFSKILAATVIMGYFLHTVVPANYYWLNAARAEKSALSVMLLLAAILVYFMTLRVLGLTPRLLKHEVA